MERGKVCTSAPLCQQSPGLDGTRLRVHGSMEVSHVGGRNPAHGFSKSALSGSWNQARARGKNLNGMIQGNL